MDGLEKKTAERKAPLSFSQQVDEVLNGTASRYGDLKVCETPKILLDIGCQPLPIHYTKRHLANAIKPKNRKLHHHGITVKQIKSVPELLQAPVMLMDSLTRNDSIVAVLPTVDIDKCPIVVSIYPNGKARCENSEIASNFATSIYGREDFSDFVNRCISSDKILYYDKQKSQELFSLLGLEFSEGLNNLDPNVIIHQSRNIVNTQNQENEKNKEEKPLTNEELMKAIAEQLGKNNDLVEALAVKINSLEEKLQSVTEKQEMFTSHFNQIYNSKSIEETLRIMSDMGKSDMEVESCDVYSYDAIEDKLFTVSESGERVYTDISENTPISAALLKNEIFIDNNYTSGEIGDGRNNENIKNVAVIPIEAKTGEVIGVVVAKNKETEFDKTDVDKFNLKNGKIGSAFRMGLENKALEQANITDKLTHLHNRKGAEKHLKNVVLPQIYEGSPVSTIMIDIDKFKNFNDTYGHDAGDKVLQTVANVLKTQTRNTDGVFRWGGEEMVVIANMNAREAYELAERLRQAVENTPCDIGNEKTVQVTTSMGVAQLLTEHPQQLNKENIMQYFEDKPLKRADKRLYKAKGNGRNQVVAPTAVMKSLQQQQDRRTSVIGSIKSAKDEEQNRPKPPKQQSHKQAKKHNQDLS